MGSQATRNLAFPSNFVKGMDYIYSAGCGGSGGAGCANPATWSYLYWMIRPSKYAVRNLHLVLQNTNFTANIDGGSDGQACAHTKGPTTVGYTVYLLYSLPGDNNFAKNAISSISVSASTALPFFLNWDSPNRIPQQNDPRWTGVIYVVLDFGQTGYILPPTQLYEAMSTSNLDFDQRQ